MKRNIALFTIALVSTLITVQPAFADKHTLQDVSPKIEKLSQGLVGRVGVAAQEIGTAESITVNGDETFARVFIPN